jgi:hypothetical protein
VNRISAPSMISAPSIKYTASGIGGGFLLIAAIFVFLRGLFLMLLFGILHGWVSEAVPTVGFWRCVVIALVLACVFPSGLNADKK